MPSLTTSFIVPNLLLGVCLVLIVAAIVLKPKKRSPALSVDKKALGDTQGPPRNSTRPPIPTTSEKHSGQHTMPARPTYSVDPTAAKQTYDAFLVLDVEATCQPGTDFNYANEIIVRGRRYLTRFRVLMYTGLGHSGMACMSVTLET